MEKIVNGKVYPLWNKFVERANEFKGGILKDLDCGFEETTVITDIKLQPNGDTSAFFRICGEEFDCRFDVSVGGVTGGGSAESITFSGYGGHTFSITKPKE